MENENIGESIGEVDSEKEKTERLEGVATSITHRLQQDLMTMEAEGIELHDVRIYLEEINESVRKIFGLSEMEEIEEEE